MTKTQHTPGPWAWSAGTGFITAPPTRVFPHGQIVAKVSGGPGKNAPDNARLIAAAPDMLEALEWISGMSAIMGGETELAKAVDAAIAKARGQ